MRFVPAIALLLASTMASTSAPAQTPFARYIGAYQQVDATGDLRFDPHANDPEVLTISISDQQLLLVWKSQSKEHQVVAALDGSRTSFTANGETSATAETKIEKHDLKIIEDLPVRTPPHMPPAHIHSVHRWQLSADGTTLKDCGYADSLGGILQFRKSGCAIYRRKP